MDYIYQITSKDNLNNDDIIKFKKLCMKYLDVTLNSRSLKTSFTKERLKYIYKYIINKYNINNNIYNIKYIIIYIIKYLNINNKGFIYINNINKIGVITSDVIYRIIEYGNLEVKGCNIFKQMFDYANKMLKLI